MGIIRFVFGEVEMSFWVQENSSYDFRERNNSSQIWEMDKKALINSRRINFTENDRTDKHFL